MFPKLILTTLLFLFDHQLLKAIVFKAPQQLVYLIEYFLIHPLLIHQDLLL